MRNLSPPFPRQVEQMGEKPMPLTPKLYFLLWWFPQLWAQSTLQKTIMPRKTSFKHNSYKIIAMGCSKQFFRAQLWQHAMGTWGAWSQKKFTPFVTTDPGTGVSKAKGAEEVLILIVDDKGTLV